MVGAGEGRQEEVGVAAPLVVQLLVTSPCLVPCLALQQLLPAMAAPCKQDSHGIIVRY